MGPRAYIEAIAHELSKLRGRGLLLSPADAQLALAWHTSGLPLEEVLCEIRRGARRRSPAARGACDLGLTLQTFAAGLDARARRSQRLAADLPARGTAEKSTQPGGLSAELLRAAHQPELAARAAWLDLARRAEDLLAHDGQASKSGSAPRNNPGVSDYWTEALLVLRLALRELPRAAALALGSELRRRLAPRPNGMPRRRYQRSLQLQLLVASSERLGVPPRAFLL